MRVLVALAVLLALTGSATPWVSAATTTLSPLVLGWERYFKVEWHPPGNGRITGYVLNEFGHPAKRIQILVEGLDQGGQIVGQRVDWLESFLNPGVRAYFDVPTPGQASTYRVRIFAFDWVQAGGNEPN